MTARSEPPCPSAHLHTDAPTGYLDWHEWARGMARTHVQDVCPGCGLWAIWRPTWTRAGSGTALVLPTGHVVTLQGSSNGSAPDQQGGMSTNSSTLWCRLTRGGYDSGWHRCDRTSTMTSRTWWDLVETEADVVEAWAGCVGEALP